jgi:hypothetical protein
MKRVTEPAKRGRPAKSGSQGVLKIANRARGFVVVDDADNGIVAGPFPTREAALQARTVAYARLKPVTQVRPCLCCDAPFPSEGAHNRLCDPCRARGSEPYNGAVSYIDWRSGALGVRHG